MVRYKPQQARRTNSGFSLLELMVSLGILLVVLGVAFEAMGKYQKRYSGERTTGAATQDLRAALSVMGQEVAQAGFGGQVVRKLTGSVAPSAIAQALPLNDTADLYVGEKLRLDAGASEETVSITSITAVTPMAVISRSHAVGAAVTAVGPFPSGILPGSTSTTLKVYGYIYPNDRLNYVEYQYNAVTQTLCRSITPITAAAKAPCDVFLQNLTAASFAYDWQTTGAWTICKRFTVTLTAQTAQRDAETNAFTSQTAAAEISPRNLLTAFQLANEGNTDGLQAQPASVPFP